MLSQNRWAERQRLHRLRRNARPTDPGRELASLRLSVRRVGELAQQNGAGSLVIPEDGAERGWNRLCAGLADFIESGRET